MSPEQRAQSIHRAWQRLLDAAFAVRSLAPWRWMSPHQRFAVRHPDTGELGFGCVLGHDGDAPGFGLHLGAGGLASLGRLLRAPLAPDDPLEALELYVAQRCLAVTFDDSLDVELPDPEWVPVAVRMPGPLRPHFRSHHPGCEPWPLTQSEARFLALALEQAVHVARRLRSAEDVLVPPVDGLLLARVADLTLAGLAWRDAWLWPPAGAPSGAPPFEVDARRLAALRDMPRRTARDQDEVVAWDVDYVLTPIAVQDSMSVRPRYPYRLVVADQAERAPIVEDEVDYDTRHAALRELVMRAVEARGERPAALCVRRPGVASALAPLAACLEVSLVRIDERWTVGTAHARRGAPVESGAA